MSTNDSSRSTTTQIPIPDYDLIRKGGKDGQEALITALQNIVSAFNQYVARKGA